MTHEKEGQKEKERGVINYLGHVLQRLKRRRHDTLVNVLLFRNTI